MLFVSCHEKMEIFSPENNSDDNRIENTHVVSIEEALANLEAFMKDPDTKAADNRSVCSVKPVKLNGHYTKGLSDGSVEDPILYKFEDWHQGSPFNDLSPRNRKYIISGHMYKSPSGCVPLAIAQILTHFEYPTTFSYNEEEYNGMKLRGRTSNGYYTSGIFDTNKVTLDEGSGYPKNHHNYSLYLHIISYNLNPNSEFNYSINWN